MEIFAEKLDYELLTRSMFRDYRRVYLVSTETGEYAEYLMDAEKETLECLSVSEDFFGMVQRKVLPDVCGEDREQLRADAERENLMSVLSTDLTFETVFRMQTGRTQVHLRAKAMYLRPDDPSRIVIAVAHAETRIRRMAALRLEKGRGLTYADLSEVLAEDYICVYYVDLDTGSYRKYKEREEYRHMGFPDRGDDFFGDGVTAMNDVIHPDDREIFNTSISGENIRRVLSAEKTFSLTYRMLFGGEWNYMSIRITRAGGEDSRHVVVEFSNVNARMQKLEEYEKMREESMEFGQIAETLAVDYLKIYYVNTETDRYIEYSSGKRKAGETGEDFFEALRTGRLIGICGEDRDSGRLDLRKEKLLRTLDRQRSFSRIFRADVEGEAVYVSLRAVRIEGDERHIIVGIRNVDEEIRREQQYAARLRSAQDLANRDPLTGVKSKHAYSVKESELDRMISGGGAEPFAAVVCDVNGLKKVNDTLGHTAGDEYICKACAQVCRIFKRSPVYRIGGDEFAVILQGADYENRDGLFAALCGEAEANAGSGDVVVAAGISDFIPASDTEFRSVFERADTAMYARKKELKRGEVRSQPERSGKNG